MKDKRFLCFVMWGRVGYWNVCCASTSVSCDCYYYYK